MIEKNSDNSENYDFRTQESMIRQRWKDIKLLHKLEQKNVHGERYFLLDGPPYANFVPHVGHIRNTVYKDLYVRWAFMKGDNVLFQPGFDTHGLPIENMVEKKLDIKSKKDIAKIGIPEFMKECRDSAALNKDLWMDVYDSLGSYYSWKKPYLTYDNSYIESAWWSFKRIWDKDLVYEGKKPVHWCPKCETALAGYEATDSYKNVTDPSIFVKFRLLDSDEQIVVYTTTPWTLPANVAIAAHPKADYVTVSTQEHGKLIIAKNRLELLTEIGIAYTIEEEFKGNELEGRGYEPLIDSLPLQQELKSEPKALKIIMSIPILKERVPSKIAMKKGIPAGDIYEDFVTDKEGTGFVHVAPGHGKTDNEVGKHYGLPELSPLDDECKFTEEAGEFVGRFVKEADNDIAKLIEKTGKLLNYDSITHNYPLCWRCKSPLIFRLSNQWFIRIDKIKETMLEANEEVEWQPDFAKERFHEWVANAEDWNFSRQRFWGIPIPIWKCECGNTIVIGSVEELNQQALGKIDESFDLHTVNTIKLRCGCGKDAERINDIFDVWFDSGCAPYSSLHYPFENKEIFEKHYPVSRINESQDQIRGWFYSLMCNGIATFGEAPYRTVSMPGWVLDEKGDKMSKSQGNVIWAKEGIEELGADAIRFYYCWDINPGDTQKFNISIVKNEVQKYFSIFWNMIKLLESSQNAMQEPKMESVEDRWIISKLNSTIKHAREQIEQFRLHNAGRAIYEFIITDLSRTYIQLVRDRMAEDMEPYFVLNRCIIEMTKLTAGITPHFSDNAYQRLKVINTSLSEESVHLERLPGHEENLIHLDLEEELLLARDIIAGILSAREKAQLGVRWPIGKIHIIGLSEMNIEKIKNFGDLIMKQTNVKELIYSDHMKGVTIDFKPDFKRIGDDYGEFTHRITEHLKENDSQHILNTIKEKRSYDFELDTHQIKITMDHISIEKQVPEDYTEASTQHCDIYLDKERTPELESEGFARELMRRVQQLRKDAGMQKSDVVELFIECNDAELTEAFNIWHASIAKKVGAEKIIISDTPPQQAYQHTSDEKVKGKEFNIHINRI